MGLRNKNAVELQVGVADEALDDIAVVVAQIEDSQLAAPQANILYNVVRPRLPQRELIFFTAILLHKFHKCVDHEGIVLGRHGEDPARRGAVLIGLLQNSDLFCDLPGIGQEPGPLLRKGDTPVGTLEDGNAHLCLQVRDGLGQAGLGDKEVLGGPANGAVP